MGIPLLALAWWLGSPLFINKTVDEEFPYSVGAVVPEGMTRAQIDQTMATMANDGRRRVGSHAGGCHAP